MLALVKRFPFFTLNKLLILNHFQAFVLMLGISDFILGSIALLKISKLKSLTHVGISFGPGIKISRKVRLA